MHQFIHNTFLVCTDHQDVNTLDLLSRLLYPRGFGKNVLFINPLTRTGWYTAQTIKYTLILTHACDFTPPVSYLANH